MEEADVAPGSPSLARKARGNGKSPEILRRPVKQKRTVKERMTVLGNAFRVISSVVLEVSDVFLEIADDFSEDDA
jgi:hypothetical protein